MNRSAHGGLEEVAVLRQIEQCFRDNASFDQNSPEALKKVRFALDLAAEHVGLLHDCRDGFGCSARAEELLQDLREYAALAPEQRSGWWLNEGVRPTVVEYYGTFVLGTQIDNDFALANEIGRWAEQLERGASQPSTMHDDDNGVHCMTIKEVEKKIATIAPSSSSVLLLGETGTGKEYYAHKIHDASPRKDRPFVAVNCAGLAEDRIDVELFGHEKNAFTGADEKNPGRIRRAEGGTIFLDELGDLSEQAQASLLRFLDGREIQPLGGGDTVDVDVRIIAATNRGPALRLDLNQRFPARLILPPLRERRDDIPRLAYAFFIEGKAAAVKAAQKKKSLRFTKAEREELAKSPFVWPGNIRQLKLAIESALAHKSGRNLTAQDVLTMAQEGDSSA